MFLYPIQIFNKKKYISSIETFSISWKNTSFNCYLNWVWYVCFFLMYLLHSAQLALLDSLLLLTSLWLIRQVFMLSLVGLKPVVSLFVSGCPNSVSGENSPAWFPRTESPTPGPHSRRWAAGQQTKLHLYLLPSARITTSALLKFIRH